MATSSDGDAILRELAYLARTDTNDVMIQLMLASVRSAAGDQEGSRLAMRHVTRLSPGLHAVAAAANQPGGKEHAE